jgi:hypothetical protein
MCGVHSIFYNPLSLFESIFCSDSSFLQLQNLQTEEDATAQRSGVHKVHTMALLSNQRSLHRSLQAQPCRRHQLAPLLRTTRPCRLHASEQGDGEDWGRLWLKLGFCKELPLLLSMYHSRGTGTSTSTSTSSAASLAAAAAAVCHCQLVSTSHNHTCTTHVVCWSLSCITRQLQLLLHTAYERVASVTLTTSMTGCQL